MSSHFKIIVPFYNVERWIKATVNSVKAQSYTNYQCILVDDMSTDSSTQVARDAISNDDRFLLIENKEKKYVLQNIVMAIETSCPEDEDVIVILDGDDWLYGKDVLATLNDTYSTKDCLLTYGSYVEYPSGVRGKFSKQVPQHVVENNLFRKAEWMTSHLRSWKFSLWDKLDHRKSFVEPDVIDEKNHFANCWDLAYMFPLLELAGNKTLFIPKIMYVYNRQNPLNVDKLDHSTQLLMERKIRNMESYDPIYKTEGD